MALRQRRAPSSGVAKSTRLRKQPSRYADSDSSNGLPGVMEEIDVLWQVGNEKEWWRAEVVSINPMSAARAVATPATIRYAAKGGFDAVDYRVSFVRATRGNKVLKHLSPEATGPVNWKYSDEYIPVSDEVAHRRKKSVTTRHSQIPPRQLVPQSPAGTPQPPVPTQASRQNTETGNESADANRHTDINIDTVSQAEGSSLQMQPVQPTEYVPVVSNPHISNLLHMHTNQLF